MRRTTRAAGSSKILGNGTTKATYNIEVTLGALVPKTIVNALVDTSLPKLLENFQEAR